ncbi:MAG: hypothetical protein ACFFDP_08520 [Promethearchaeota archaeon]
MSSAEVRAKLSALFLPIIIAVGLTVYFVVLFNLTLLPGVLPMVIRSFAMPLIFTFPWVLFFAIFRERTVNAWNAMKVKTSIIPLRWRMLYGFNTIIVISFFILPFISPPLAVFAALVLAWRIVYHSDFIWQKGPTTRILYGGLLFAIIAALPCYLLIIWFQYYLSYIAAVILATWIEWFDVFYFVSICIVDALAIGALLHLSYGTLDPKGNVRMEKGTIIWTIRSIEFIFAGFLLLLVSPYWTPLGFGIGHLDPLGLNVGLITYINWACLALICMVYFVKICVGIRGDTSISLLGVLLAAAFLLVELFQTFNIVLKGVLVVSSSLFFVIGFLISFFTSPDELVTRLEDEPEPEEDLTSEQLSLEDEAESEVEEVDSS